MVRSCLCLLDTFCLYAKLSVLMGVCRADFLSLQHARFSTLPAAQICRSGWVLHSFESRLGVCHMQNPLHLRLGTVCAVEVDGWHTAWHSVCC
jgi:hypothetical protein